MAFKMIGANPNWLKATSSGYLGLLIHIYEATIKTDTY